MKHNYFNQLSSIITHLRSKKGCEWDQSQTNESLIPNLLEEVYEVIEAIYKKDDDNLKEELGDLLFLILLQIEIKNEKNDQFCLEEICKITTEKLIRRHPHIFGENKQYLTKMQVIENWEKIKQTEKQKDSNSILKNSKKKFINPIEQATKIQKKVAKVGFDWKNKNEVIQKLKEEVNEFLEAFDKNDKNHMEEEIGDMFFTMINLCRHLDISPEKTILFANLKFIDRFEKLEKFILNEKKEFSNYKLQELESIWQKIKNEI